LIPAAMAGGAGALIALWLNWPKPVAAALGAGLALWAIAGALIDFARRTKAFSTPSRNIFARLAGLPRSYIGMTLAHIGLGVVALGVIGAGAWRTETIRLMQVGDAIEVGAYEAKLSNVVQSEGPNYVTELARFSVMKNGRPVRDMTAERRFYPVRGMQTTEAAIWTTLSGDVYLTLGEQAQAGGWAVRAYYNPLVIWLWFGAGVLALGGAVAAGERAFAPRARKAPIGAASAGATA
jgi:cytochrome c-type biogenesis protein CcmF